MKWAKEHIGLIKLTGLLLALPILVFSWNITTTIRLYTTIKKQSAQVQTAHTDSMRVVDADIVDSLTSSSNYIIDDEIKSGAILHHLAPIIEKYGVTAERYTPYQLTTDAASELYIGELVLSGEFIKLTRLLDELENRKTNDRIISVSYRTAVNSQTRKKQLQITVIFQQITQI